MIHPREVFFGNNQIVSKSECQNQNWIRIDLWIQYEVVFSSHGNSQPTSIAVKHFTLAMQPIYTSSRCLFYRIRVLFCFDFISALTPSPDSPVYSFICVDLLSYWKSNWNEQWMFNARITTWAWHSKEHILNTFTWIICIYVRHGSEANTLTIRKFCVHHFMLFCDHVFLFLRNCFLFRCCCCVYNL